MLDNAKFVARDIMTRDVATVHPEATLLDALKRLQIKVVGLTGNAKSTIAQASEVVLDVSVNEEACSLNLAPTASTTVAMAVGDALAVALLEKRDFRHDDFAALHPAGSLGKRLLRVEKLMHRGDKLPRVSCPKDFEDKRGLFARLERGEGPWAQRSSDFAGLVSRMLKTDPEDRWSSMSDVANWLSDIEIAETDEERAKRTAQGVYLRLQKGNKPREFFERFYENLFATSVGVQALFRPGSMDKQKEMLNRAVELLLKFDPACGCPELRRLAGSHVRYQLTKEHYDLFLDVLVRTSNT